MLENHFLQTEVKKKVKNINFSEIVKFVENIGKAREKQGRYSYPILYFENLRGCDREMGCRIHYQN